MSRGESFLVWHFMLGFGRFKVWFERDDDGDFSVGCVVFGFKFSYLYEVKKPEVGPAGPGE